MTTMKMEWDGNKLSFTIGFASMEEVTTFLNGSVGPALRKFGYKILLVKDKSVENKKVVKQ
jgi:hypothetical protein